MEISEEIPLLKKHPVKRRMEAKGGEVRRVHIIYFLSRMGKIEHPHLIRVHHMNRAGVHLRDVKRWLSDLRGKEMPDSFSWSYKRRYKTGFVWQDLLDDDLITPISDNEYVLKGSEIPAFPLDPCASVDTKNSIQKSDLEEDKTHPCSDTHISSKPAQTETETEEDDLVKRPVAYKLEGEGEDDKILEFEPAKEDPKDSVKNKKEKSRRSSTSSFSKANSSNGASQVFRNLLKCGAIDTNDSAMMLINRRSKAMVSNLENGGEICKAEAVGGSQRVYGGTWNQQQNARKSTDGMKSSRKKNAVDNKKPVSAAYKPVAEPNCSQCGKAFKPEKLHAHMKSCRALKSRGGKGGTAAEKIPQTTDDKSTTTKGFLLNPSLVV